MSSQFEHGYALIIGVDANQIQRLALPTVAKDVQAVHEVLVHPERCAYAPENVTLVQGEQATRKEILQQLRQFKEKVKADPEATAVLYYSGHGMADKSNGRYYLIPYDISSLSYVRSDAIEAETFAAEISDIPAKRLLVILDCCHADGMGVKNVELITADEADQITTAPFPIDLAAAKDIPAYTAQPGGKNVADLLEGEGRAILNSSTGAQSSFVRQDRVMSLFTYHLIEALTGHAPHPDDAKVVYVTDVMSWVTHQVKKSAQQQGVAQTPVMRTSGVFPVAQLIGGKGVALAKGEVAPDPLEWASTFHQNAHAEGGGHAVNLGNNANVGQIGNNTHYTLEDVSGNVALGEGAMITHNSGDTFNLSGNFQGANLNVKSTLTNVTQSIGALPHADEDSKQQLAQLLAQLNTLLQNAPPEQAQTAENIATTTQAYVEMAADENANPSVVQVLGEGLKGTARQLVNQLPEIVDVVTKITTAVATLSSV